MRDHDMAHTRNNNNKKTPSMHSEQIGQHQASYNSHDEEVYHLKKKVDWLCRRLHCKAWIREERTPSLDQSSSFEDDKNYK